MNIEGRELTAETQSLIFFQLKTQKALWLCDFVVKLI